VWSDQFFRIMGYEPGEVTPGQEPWLAVLHPEDREWASTLFAAERHSGVHAFTYRIIVAGQVRWIRESWKDFTSDDGSHLSFGVTADITDWKEREHRYTVTDRWLALAVAGGRIGLWSHDGPAYAYHWNDDMFTLLGYRKGEIEPSEQAWYDRIHPADLERVKSALEERRADDREVVIEYRVLLPGNVERWLEERGSAKEKGASIHHGVLFDITEQKLFQQQLEASQQKLQLALDTGQLGFWTGHEDTEEWDERTYRILGYEPFSVTPCSETFLRTVHPEDRPKVLALEDWARHSGDEVIQEYRIVWPDGAVRWIESRRWHAAGEKPDRYGVVADITERKVREEFHIRSERLEAAGQLLRGLAHDFNNFLAVISATLEPIGEMTSDPETARRLLVARQAAMAGTLFSRRLINISKHREWRPQRLSIGEHVSRLADIMRPLMKKGIILSIQYPDDLWTVNVDPLECDSAIINLLINARDAIATAGSVTITVSNELVRSAAANAQQGGRLRRADGSRHRQGNGRPDA
jgi:PAS domain S-box-containing protein